MGSSNASPHTRLPRAPRSGHSGLYLLRILPSSLADRQASLLKRPLLASLESCIQRFSAARASISTWLAQPLSSTSNRSWSGCDRLRPTNERVAIEVRRRLRSEFCTGARVALLWEPDKK